MYEMLKAELRSMCCLYGDECLNCDANGHCRSRMEHKAADAIEEFEKSIPRWISVTDRLPEEKELVLGYTPHDGYMFVGYRQRWTSNKCDWLIVTARGYTKTMKKRVTHWMPLPEPPKEE